LLPHSFRIFALGNQTLAMGTDAISSFITTTTHYCYLRHTIQLSSYINYNYLDANTIHIRHLPQSISDPQSLSNRTINTPPSYCPIMYSAKFLPHTERPMKVEIALDPSQLQSLASRVSAPPAPARNGAAAGAARGRGGRGGAGKPRAARPKPKTAEELDAEMSVSFLSDRRVLRC
jgi:THO complex subunit 4